MAVPVMEFDRVCFRYSDGNSGGSWALDQISFSVEKGEFIGIVGANGSGKSTLAQLMNGLLCPHSGRVTVLGGDTSDKRCRERLWMKVGLVFQQPEQQLFEETVFADVAYGLKNMGASPAEVSSGVQAALRAVGLEPGEVGKLAPLALSGGQRRRTAIAGVLAMK
ncbi:energy-coupling factor ABC transporter ATP-binding protein, partial [Paenibacillus forsythiae]